MFCCCCLLDLKLYFWSKQVWVRVYNNVSHLTLLHMISAGFLRSFGRFSVHCLFRQESTILNTMRDIFTFIFVFLEYICKCFVCKMFSQIKTRPKSTVICIKGPLLQSVWAQCSGSNVQYFCCSFFSVSVTRNWETLKHFQFNFLSNIGDS